MYGGARCAGPHKTTESRCPDQPDPRPTLALTPNPNPNTNPLGGSRSALEVGRGSIELACKSEDLARTYYVQLNAWSSTVAWSSSKNQAKKIGLRVVQSL